MSRVTWLAPVVAAAACVPCLLALFGGALFVTGATSAVLAALVNPWILLAAAPLLAGAGLVFVWRRRSQTCDLPESKASRVS